MNRLRNVQLAAAGLKETGELFQFVSDAIYGYRDAKADGVFTWKEKAALAIKVTPEAIAGLKDAGKILGELDNCDRAGEELLGDIIWEHVAERSIAEQELTSRVIAAVREILGVVYFVRHREHWTSPPKARIIE